ncbi:MAG TPA: hypothetical protein VFG56_02835 [Candidatus Saccharimonadales bacterium]|nr:hypothetical protein [Candidatus Saccharimonadales bacterium]
MVATLHGLRKNPLLAVLVAILIISWAVILSAPRADALSSKYFSDDAGGDNCDAWITPGRIGCGRIEIRLIDGQTRYVRRTSTNLAAYFTKSSGSLRIYNANFCNGVSADDVEGEDYFGNHTMRNGTAVTKFTFRTAGGTDVRYGRKYSGGGNCNDSINMTFRNLRKDKRTGLYYVKIEVDTVDNRRGSYDGIQNSYSIAETGGGTYMIAQKEGYGSGYGVTVQQRGTNPRNMTYKVRFGASCSVKNPGTYRLYYYDMDNDGGSGAQLGGKITMRLIEVGTGRVTSWTPRGKANAPDFKRVTIRPGKRYVWEINNVYYNNTLQFSTPFDGIYYEKPCDPKPDVCPNIPGNQASVPRGYIKQGGKCLKDHCPDIPGLQTNDSLCKVDVIPLAYISPAYVEVGDSATVTVSYKDTANYDKEQAKNDKKEEKSYVDIPSPYCKSSCHIQTKFYEYSGIKYEGQIWFDNGDKKYRAADDDLVYDTDEFKGERFTGSGGTLGTHTTGETELSPLDDPNFLVCSQSWLVSGYYTYRDRGDWEKVETPVYKYRYVYVGSGGNYRRDVSYRNGKRIVRYVYNDSGPYSSSGNYIGYGGSYNSNGTYNPNDGAYDRDRYIDHYDYSYRFPDDDTDKVRISPSSDPSTPAACSVIQRWPDIQVTGGDVRAGGSFADALDNCSASPARIIGHLHSVESDLRGSFGEYGVLATDDISHYGSNSVVSTNGSLASELYFANTGAPGNFSGGWCFNEVFDSFPNPTWTGNSWSGGNIELGPNDRMVIRVNGPARITGDILTSSIKINSINQLPEFVLIADGDITIDSDVTEIDGIFVTKGNFITCNGHTQVNSSISLDEGSACREALVVNGAVIAGGTIKAYRTNAASDDYLAPAELFNLDGATIISDYSAKLRTGEYTIIGERELPPRF